MQINYDRIQCFDYLLLINVKLVQLDVALRKHEENFIKTESGWIWAVGGLPQHEKSFL